MSTSNGRKEGAVEKRGAKGAQRWYGRVPKLPDGSRPWVPLSKPGEQMSEARARQKLLALIEHGREKNNLSELVRALRERDFQPRRKVAKPSDVAGPKAVTFGDVAKKWTDGELARDYPDHVREKRSAPDDKSRLDKHVLPVVRDVPIASFALTDAERVMAALPPTLKRNTRRNIAVTMHRVLQLSVYPLRLIEHNPLPKGWVPRTDKAKAKAWMYPSEEQQLLASPHVPFHLRLLYGFLSREGMRKSEALSLTWADVDIEHGTVSLDANKSDHARTWQLGDDVTRALRIVHKSRKPERSAHVCLDEHGKPLRNDDVRPDDFRVHAKLAGIDRPQLFTRSATREHLRLHDTRTTFITLALACGRTESWVRRRTGHKSSQMIARYEQMGALATELGLGWFAPLDAAIPELSTPDAPSTGPSTPHSNDDLEPEQGDESNGFEPETTLPSANEAIPKPKVTGSTPVGGAE